MSFFKRKSKKKQDDFIELKKIKESCDFIAPGFNGIYHKYTDSKIKGSNVYAVYETKDIRNVKYLSGDTMVKKV